MKRLASTLATIWRLSIPYFRSEDRWPGRILLGAVVAIELSIVAIQVILNQWYNRLLQHAAGPQLERFRQRHPVLLRARRGLYRARGLSELSQSMAADPLAALDDADLSAAMAQYRQPLPHAASRRRRRQSRSAHRRRSADVRAEHAVDRPRASELLRDAVLVRRHPVDAVGSGAAASVRRIVGDSGLSGLGGADLRGDRHRRSRI